MFVMRAQPMGEMRDLLVAPHPRGKPRERILRIQRPRMMAQTLVAHMTIDARRIRPIGLHRHDGEAVVGDQPLGDRGAGIVELGGAMGSFAQKHNASLCEAIKKGTEVRGLLWFGKMDALVAHQRCSFIGALRAKPCGDCCVAHVEGSLVGPSTHEEPTRSQRNARRLKVPGPVCGPATMGHRHAAQARDR